MSNLSIQKIIVIPANILSTHKHNQPKETFAIASNVVMSTDKIQSSLNQKCSKFQYHKSVAKENYTTNIQPTTEPSIGITSSSEKGRKPTMVLRTLLKQPTNAKILLPKKCKTNSTSKKSVSNDVPINRTFPQEQEAQPPVPTYRILRRIYPNISFPSLKVSTSNNIKLKSTSSFQVNSVHTKEGIGTY